MPSDSKRLKLSLEQALSNIWANPEAIPPRLVFADMLSALSDVRGEFITLQCLPNPTREQEKRIQTLLAEHRSQWLGPLFFAIQQAHFELGFPASVLVPRVSAAQLSPVFGHPAWSTVHTIELQRDSNLEQPIGLILDRSMTRLERVVCLGSQEVRRLGQLGWAMPLRSICFFDDGEDATWDALQDSGVFPRLVRP